MVRYRDDGYSREMPPVAAKPKPTVTELPAWVNLTATDFKIFKEDNWSECDGAMFGKADANGSPLTGPIKINYGAIEL